VSFCSIYTFLVLLEHSTAYPASLSVCLSITKLKANSFLIKPRDHRPYAQRPVLGSTKEPIPHKPDIVDGRLVQIHVETADNAGEGEVEFGVGEAEKPLLATLVLRMTRGPTGGGKLTLYPDTACFPW